jgi:hypothetical protein
LRSKKCIEEEWNKYKKGRLHYSIILEKSKDKKIGKGGKKRYVR